jgi:EAL domain-containing protein (putative c-di-GMP-specific phosphodiesterase class I)
VTASIAFAHALGLEVTAEGVETRIQLDRLTELGCDRGQGYLIGRPIGFEHVIGLLQTEHLDIRQLKPSIRPVLLTDGTALAG